MRRDMFVASLGSMLLQSATGLAAPSERRWTRRRPRLPRAMEEYISGWLRGDGEGVAALFDEAGSYADDTGVALKGEALVEYVASFAEAQFRVVDVDRQDDGFIIHWRVGAGRCGDTIAFRDEVVLSECGQMISSVQSRGYPPSEQVGAVLAEYVAGWTNYDGQRTLDTFAEGGLYFDPFNPEGISGAELVAYIEGLTWARITGFYDVAVLKDGRIFARWNLYLVETGELLVQSYDVITMQETEILVVRGY